jgi:hypothetical protein
MAKTANSTAFCIAKSSAIPLICSNAMRENLPRWNISVWCAQAPFVKIIPSQK